MIDLSYDGGFTECTFVSLEHRRKIRRETDPIDADDFNQQTLIGNGGRLKRDYHRRCRFRPVIQRVIDVVAAVLGCMMSTWIHSFRRSRRRQSAQAFAGSA